MQVECKDISFWLHVVFGTCVTDAVARMATVTGMIPTIVIGIGTVIQKNIVLAVIRAVSHVSMIPNVRGDRNATLAILLLVC